MPIAEKLFSQDHPEYAYLLSKVAELHFKQGEYLAAEAARKQANYLFKKFNGKVSFTHVFGVNSMAEIHEYKGEYSAAKQLYLEAIRIRKELDASNLIRIATMEKNLARLLVKTGEYQAAKSLIDQAITVYDDYEKDNLYNKIIQAAAIIETGENITHCQSGMQRVLNLLPQLQQMPINNWRRMMSEIWIGELAQKCDKPDMAKKYLDMGLAKSNTVYNSGSMGQQIITHRINNLFYQ